MRTQRIARRLLLLMLILVLLAGAAFWTLRNLGGWLVRPDPLQRARAVVVLSGSTPFRAMEAAEIYREGWVPEVWLLRDEPTGADEEFAKLGITHFNEHDYDQQVLEKLGVPKQAIRVLDSSTTNTLSEIRLVAKELRKLGADKVILVTSPVHTRRSKLIWHKVVGDSPNALLRYDAGEMGDPNHWWRDTEDVQDVEHEVLGLIDAYLGFAVKHGA
jgi:uncharacterized SAM-binding protein YcdF (DUF218 family)